MKKPFFSLLLLIIVVGGLLYFQWVEYANSEVGSSKDIKTLPTQKITVTRTNTSLQIEQEVAGLQKGLYKTYIPAGIHIKECVDSDENECVVDESIEIINKSETIRMKYEISVEGHTFILEPWIQFPTTQFSTTKIEVVEPLPFEGTWLASAPLVGHTTLSTIAYYQFKGEHGPFPLFRTEQDLSASSNHFLTIYGDGSEPSFQSIFSYNLGDKFPHFGKWNIVLSDFVPSYSEQGLLILPSTVSNQEIVAELVRTYVKEKFHLRDQEGLSFIVGSILADQKIGSTKSWVYEQLKSNLTKAEFLKLQEHIIAHISKPITPEWLDEQLFLVKGLETNFISESIKTKEQREPLFFDPRHILANGHKGKFLSIIEGGLRYYPLEETMSLLNFDVSYLPEKGEITIQNNHKTYRFYTDKPVYIENNEKYVLQQVPISQFNQNFYIEEGWLRRLFHLEISVVDESIQLKRK